MKQLIEAIRKHKSFLVTAHVNMEGDSLGSQLAMKELLEALGKKVYLLDHDLVPELYQFMPKSDQVLSKLPKGVSFDAALVLDCPTLKRVGSVAEVIGDTYLINVDHHISNEKFGSVNWVDSHASSAGEIVYRLFKEMGVPLTRDAALDIYIAILTDTGSFNYDNTSSMTHEIAGELLGYGFDPSTVAESVYERKSLADIKLLGLVLSTIKVSKAGDIASMHLTREMIRKTGADIARSEGLVNYARSIDTVKVAVLFKEDLKDKDKINISFRSKSEANVNAIASSFGGGGHVKAAGCVVKGTLADVKKKVLAKIEEELKRR